MARRGTIRVLCLFLFWCCSDCVLIKQHQYNDILKPQELKDQVTARKHHIEGPHFKDAKGRTCIFHGFNAVQKSFPWYPEDLLNITRLNHYREWGFNVIRLGTMWAGAQPSEHIFNQTYLNIMSDIVGRLQAYGLHVILDMHQDVLSSKYNAYDGVPQWIIEKLPAPDHPFPWPLPHELQWSDGYVTEAVSQAFQGIYKNKGGTADDMAAFWSKIAEEFKHYDNVLGYELFNEPWAGDIYHDLGLLIPGVAGRKNLAPLYDRINTAIRKVDPDGIIFYEPVTWGVFFNGSSIGSGFKTVPGGDQYRNKSCLAYHYYCWALGGDEHKNYSDFTRDICDKTIGPLVFKAVSEDITVTGGASFLTEFGLCDPDGQANSTATQECDFVLEQADKNLQSWTYWDAGFFNESTGKINENIVKAFARVYPRAVAGTIKFFHFDPQTNVFEMSYEVDRSIKSPSEIFVPTLHYPYGFRVSASEGVKWYFDVSSQVLSVWMQESNEINASSSCSIQITPYSKI